MLLIVSWPPSASAPLHRVAAPRAGDAGREAQRRVRRGAVADRDRDPAVGEVGRLVDEQLAHPDVDRQSSASGTRPGECPTLGRLPTSAPVCSGSLTCGSSECSVKTAGFMAGVPEAPCMSRKRLSDRRLLYLLEAALIACRREAAFNPCSDRR